MSCLSGSHCRAGLQHLGVSPGCPQARGLCRSCSTCPGGAGMLQGWCPGMPVRGREGHLVCQSLEHQNLPWTSKRAQEFSAQLWCGGTSCTSVPTQHPGHGAVCALVSWEHLRPSRKKFSISLLAQTLGLDPCSVLHFVMCWVQGTMDECGIHTVWVLWNSWTPQHTNGHHDFFVCGQSSISPWSLERLVENNLTATVSVLHLNRGIHFFSGEVKYFSGMFLAYHFKISTK